MLPFQLVSVAAKELCRSHRAHRAADKLRHRYGTDSD
jgi:hypothetical protein